MRKSIFFVSMFIFLASICNSAQIRTSDDFDVTIPVDWVEIPRNVLDAYSASLKELAPNAPPQVYDYGFQLGGSENWLEFPYILIQVNNNGRVPESELKKIKKIKYEMEKGTEKLKDLTSEIISGATVGETLYDESDHILWTNLSFNVDGIGAASSLVAVILTEKGTISVYGYSLKNEFEQYGPLFEKFTKDLSLKEALRYKPRLTDSMPGAGLVNWGSGVTNTFVGAAIGGIVALLVGLIKKRKGSS